MRDSEPTSGEKAGLSSKRATRTLRAINWASKSCRVSAEPRVAVPGSSGNERRDLSFLTMI